MITQEQINRGGSKLEITRALLENKLEIPIPRSIWLYYGENLDSIRHEFEGLRKPVIIRGSHPNDYHGAIDVIPTFKNVNSFSDLETSVIKMINYMKNESVKIHFEDWEQPYSEDVHFLIQEQMSPIVGSMIRHPNHEDRLIIQYFNADRYEPGGKELISLAICKMDKVIHNSNIGITDYKIRELIEMYEKLERSGIVDTSYSQQVEFGLSPLMFYQARPFKKFENVKRFEMPIHYKEKTPDISKEKYPYITSIDTFGLTPEQGIDCSFVIVDDGI